jgi:hypothetical protein
MAGWTMMSLLPLLAVLLVLFTCDFCEALTTPPPHPESRRSTTDAVSPTSLGYYSSSNNNNDNDNDGYSNNSPSNTVGSATGNSFGGGTNIHLTPTGSSSSPNTSRTNQLMMDLQKKNLTPPTGSSSSPKMSRTNQLMMDLQKNNREITQQWEAEIQTNTKEKADVQRVQRWLEEPKPTKPKIKHDNGWKVALASGTVCGLGCEWFSDSPILSLATFCGVFFVALRDPMEEEDESLAGPVARIIGRSAIKSYETTEPKLKAVARAAVQGEEAWTALQAEVVELRKENAQLKLYAERREWIDEEQSQYNLEELKVLAQRYRVPYSGVTKAPLMMRLLQVGALRVVTRM